MYYVTTMCLTLSQVLGKEQGTEAANIRPPVGMPSPLAFGIHGFHTCGFNQPVDQKYLKESYIVADMHTVRPTKIIVVPILNMYTFLSPFPK